MSQPLTEVVEVDPAIVEDRRLRVQSMTLRRLSPRAIAAVLQEAEATVAADLEWLKSSHAARFGPVPTLDPSQEIGWAVADFEEMESVAWMEFHQLKQEAQQRRLSPMFVARARQGWIRTAAMMRVLRLKLLAEHGYLLPSASTKSVTGAGIPRAEELRAMLRQEGLLDEVTASVSAKALVADLQVDGEVLSEELLPTETVDAYLQWMDDGGFFEG